MSDTTRRSSPSPSWLEAVLLVLFTFLVLAFAAARSPGAALPPRAGDGAGATVDGLADLGPPADLASAASGALLLRTTQPGLYLPAPRVATDVVLRVQGFVERARVRQRFRNPTDAWVEGVYVFPLPPGAAVDTLRLEIGARVLEGVVEERAAARGTYEAAKAGGYQASLVEQERPNVFTTSIANLGPGEEATVEIEYQDELRYDDGAYELRFPLVVAPRYVPGAPRDGASAAGGFAPDTDRVPDGARITPPVAPAVRNPVRLRVELDAGFPLAGVTSPSHAIEVLAAGAAEGAAAPARPGDRAVTVRLAAESVPADRDFVLTWRLRPDAAPRATVFTEARPEGTYALAMLVPPSGAAPAAGVPREEIFVVDTSGSMTGASLAQAKEALRFALSTLHADDRFNVIQFNSTTARLFDEPQMAFPDALQRALAYVDGLASTGGTEMRPALELALGEPAARGLLRQVVFMTDGSVGNEDELFAFLRERLGETRLFTVGIGSAPNAHFLRQAAELGRGTFTAVGAPEEVAAKMGALFRKLGSPALTDLELELDDLAAEAWPARAPDVYQGEPVTVAVRLAKPASTLRIRGLRGDTPWAQELAIGGTSEKDGAAARAAAGGIEKLWARRKIATLLDGAIEGRDPAAVRADVTAVALEHHLVSPYTSLVAVDVTPTAPAAGARTVLLPVALPAGWVYEDAWGTLPATATPRDLLLTLGLAFAALALALRRREAA